MSDSDKGLYQKFIVYRTDGTSEKGGKHAGCDYFVLDIDHDECPGGESCADSANALPFGVSENIEPWPVKYQWMPRPRSCRVAMFAAPGSVSPRIHCRTVVEPKAPCAATDSVTADL